VSDGGEDGVGGIAGTAFEITAAEVKVRSPVPLPPRAWAAAGCSLREVIGNNRRQRLVTVSDRPEEVRARWSKSGSRLNAQGKPVGAICIALVPGQGRNPLYLPFETTNSGRLPGGHALFSPLPSSLMLARC
jgi:hypothetical protein